VSEAPSRPAPRIHPKAEIRLEVKIPTATLLKVLWTANMAKGSWQVETANEIPTERKVKVALMLPSGEVLLTGMVKSCTEKKGKKGYFVGVALDEPTREARDAIDKLIGTVREFKRKEDKDADLFDDSDIEIK
jgi:hypothetical protein